MSGQDALALVPGRPLHDEIAQATRRRDRINAQMAFAAQVQAAHATRKAEDRRTYPVGYGEAQATGV